MKEIKLQVWDSYKDEWVKDFCFLPNGEILGMDKRMNVIFLVSIGADRRYIKRQFTGLKDRNGVEIYGGDIIEYNLDFNPTTETGAKKRISEVFWSDFRASWSVYGDGAMKRTNNDLFNYVQNGNTVTVIGNIYEHPHLLEK